MLSRAKEVRPDFPFPSRQHVTFGGHSVPPPSTWKLDPNKGHSWVATKRGTTGITLTITANGHRVTLGVVRVVVRS